MMNRSTADAARNEPGEHRFDDLERVHLLADGGHILVRALRASDRLDEPAQPGVAVARFARDPHDPTTAEAAVTVLESHCNRGIGTVLLMSLVEAALARGITTFTASVLWENQVLLDGLRAYGAVVAPAEPGVAAVRVTLPRGAEHYEESVISRVLRTVATRLGSGRSSG